MELTFEQWLEANPTAKRDYDAYAADPLTQARFKLFWIQGGTNAARQIIKNLTQNKHDNRIKKSRTNGNPEN